MDNEKQDLVEVAIDSIQESVSNEDFGMVNSYVYQIRQRVRILLKECNSDTIACFMMKLLNRFASTFPSVRIEACERLDEELTIYMNNIEYEKYVLKELKKYLRYCSRSRGYDDVDLSFGILIALLVLHKDRNKRIKNSMDVWNCGIKGIRYIPVSNNDNMEELMDSIDSSLNILRRKK